MPPIETSKGGGYRFVLKDDPNSSPVQSMNALLKRDATSRFEQSQDGGSDATGITPTLTKL